MAPSADPTKNTTSVEAADEITPLLTAPESGSPVKDSNGTPNGPSAPTQQDEDTLEEPPMPNLQIILLCYSCLAEPIAYFAIFPFINEMLERNGHVAEENVGFWAGLIESLFSLVQMVLMIFYGRMADRLGRKPVLVFSLAGVSLATALFGMARTLTQMILLRCFAGVFAGSVVTIRTMISENATKSTQGRAFSWYMFTRNLGIFLGPLVGGGLANPAEQFPGTFGHSQFFIDYPYALATFVAGAVCMTGTMSSLFFLKETLKRKSVDQSNPEPPMTTLQVLKSPGVRIVLYIFGHTMFLGLVQTAVAPVTMYTSISKGGLSFSPQYISYFLACAGASQALWMLLLFPPLQRNLGTGRLLRIASAFWPLFMLQFPVLNALLRAELYTPFWILLGFCVVLGSGLACGFACVQLCLNDVSPSPAVLGTVNALALTVNSGVRAVTPALFTSVYAFGVKSGWANGQLAWIIIAALAAFLNVAVAYLPEAAEGRLDQQKGKKKDVEVDGQEQRPRRGEREDGKKTRSVIEKVIDFCAIFIATLGFRSTC